MSDGILLIDKPAGPTSHDVVGAVRRALDQSRVGHAGTLDPPATGLLVVLVGRATRLARFIGMLPKRYTGTVLFGWETTTDDMFGEPTSTPDTKWRTFSQADIDRALQEVASRPEQQPPPVSAKKVDGVRAYKRVRRGERPELKSVPVTIHSLTSGPWTSDAPELLISIECSSGTYVRSVARDIGRALGTLAHLGGLRRTSIGSWSVEQALALGELGGERREEGDSLPSPLSSALRPMREAIAHIPAVILPADEARRFALGQKIPATAPTGPVAVFDSADLLGVADMRDGLLRPDVVLVG